MTVGENVAFGLKLRKLPSSETRRRVAEMLEMVQLLHLIDRYPGELSGGQQQRVALARAIIIRPSVLLLDEPLSNLDAKLREEMRLEIRRLHEEFKMTTVYVTHDQGEAMVTSDRIAVMNGGRIEQIDRPYELYMRPTTQFVASFLGRTNFIKATVTDKRISFCGLDLPIARINVVPPESGDVIISIRPQFMTLRKGEVATTGAETVINGVVVRRYFYGDYWDYMVRCEETGEVLCVNARPQDAVEVGTRVGLEIDPTLIAPLASSNPAAVRPGSAVESIRS
jgi:iron(III) transport system ATP-binding protein